MNPLDIELIKSIAGNPNVVLHELMSPNILMSWDWIKTPIVRQCVKHAADLTLRDREVTWLTLMAAVPMATDERKELMQAWDDGKKNRADWHMVYEELKHNNIIQKADGAIGEYHSRIRVAPKEAVRHINNLVVSLSQISATGEDWNPNPIAHLDDPMTSYDGHWGMKTLDTLMGGGKPSYGYALYTGPSGFGKSTSSRTFAANAILSGYHVAMLLNDRMTAGTTANLLIRAIDFYTGGQMTHDNIKKLIRDKTLVWQDVKDYSKLEQVARYYQPDVLILDSLDDLGFIPGTERFQYNDQHKARANGFKDIGLKYGTLLLVTGNMGESGQSILRDGIGKAQSAMMHSSVWYYNKATWAWVLTYSKDEMNKTKVKIVKMGEDSGLLQTGILGQVLDMSWSRQGQCYYDEFPRTGDGDV